MTFFIDIADKRNQILKALLAEKKQETQEICFMKKAVKNDVFIFAPNKKFDDDFLTSLTPNTNLICGALSENQQKILKTKNIQHLNVLSDEVFAIKNSWLTAEGILAIILEKSPESIYESKILILGSGRVGKATAAIFAKMGLINFSLVSNSVQNFAQTFLFSSTNFFAQEHLNNLKNFDIIINTIPEQTIPENLYNTIKPNCLFLEIASIQSINVNIAKFNYVLCPALPQKYSCISAAKVFLEAIEKMLKLTF